VLLVAFLPLIGGAAASDDRPAAQSLWSLQPVKRTVPPRVKSVGANPIDAFVRARLERQRVPPSPSAERPTLIRRLSLDLRGLPPTIEEVEAFIGDTRPGSYARLVERMLASQAFGERMALQWLDLARYADTDGYHDDTDRAMWAWRDWVIYAFNANLPFDQFTIEQLAGDLLPNATRDQVIASAFNRLGPTSSEGGAIVEEYAAKYAVDRVNTTVGVWQGLTIQCAECHDHKFDPLSTREYYQLFALFNQVPENVLYRGADAPPTIAVPTAQQQVKLDELARTIATLEEEVRPRTGVADPKAEEKRAAESKKKLDEVRQQRSEVEKMTKLRIMADQSPRKPTFVLTRGDYRKHGPEVQPGVPAALLSARREPFANRLDFARWLVDGRNPLTARVAVNRLWHLLFGVGLVKTSEDFGTRGERPSHPELLDWLAAEFVECGWDVKHLLRLLVMSATYQQSSKIEDRGAKIDTDNRLLARGPRVRLPAELIRDNALAVVGLLDRGRAPGGPSVRPYQPGDLWRELASGDQASRSYVQDHGADLYRRGLYTFWKRSIHFPAFSVFDAPKRETCVVRRLMTNTPLQAFVVMNDTAFVEAARVFAQRILLDGGATTDSRLSYAFRRALAREPNPRERVTITRLLNDALREYRTNVEAANKLASAGEFPRPKELDVAEHAAWTCVCNAILILDETITKE